MWSVQEVHTSGRGKVQQFPCELLLKTTKKEIFSLIPALKMAHLFKQQTICRNLLKQSMQVIFIESRKGFAIPREKQTL
jgi:hypothetical protein